MQGPRPHARPRILGAAPQQRINSTRPPSACFFVLRRARDQAHPRRPRRTRTKKRRKPIEGDEQNEPKIVKEVIFIILQLPIQMTTAQQFGDYYYDSRYSPPVSPKSLPHGYKRKASTQDDDLEQNSLISNSFKKLRLSRSPSDHVASRIRTCAKLDPVPAKRHSAVDLAPVGIAYRDIDAQQPSPSHYGHDSSFRSDSAHGSEDEGMMVDDTTDRTWVHDLDAEIAEIEAEEARHQNENLLNTAADQEVGKIPQHLLRGNTPYSDAQSNMQMILYRDPISISVPEEHDAVRKTIIEARRRMREKQAEDYHHGNSPTPDNHAANPTNSPENEGEDDSMDID